MRHRRLNSQLSVKTQHRRAILKNLVRGLVRHHRIQTTVAKAKAASPFADRMVELAKRGDLHARRLLIAKLGCSETAHSLITRIAPRFGGRRGGYTRVLRIGKFRPGDATELALLEFTETIELAEKAKKPKKEKKPKPEKQAKTEQPPAKPLKEKAPTAKPAEGEARRGRPEEKEGKKESEKKGGFLSRLRKFLKGDE